MSEYKEFNSLWPKIQVPFISVPHFIIEKLRFYGNRTFLIEDETGQSFTFNQLANDSLRFAKALTSSGIKDGDHFGIIGQNNYEFIVTLFGGLIAGGIGVPISANYTIDEINSKIVNTSIKFLNVTTRNQIEYSEQFILKYKQGLKRIISFGHSEKYRISSNEYSNYRQKINHNEFYSELHIGVKKLNHEKDVCIIIESNGTGENQANACMISHYNLIAHLTVSSLPFTGFGWNDNDIVLNTSPFWHIMGLTQLLVALTVGAKFIIPTNLNAKNIAISIKKYKVTSIILTPTIITDFIKDQQTDCDFNSLKKVICTGATLNKKLANQFIELFDIEDMRQAYGLTEMTGFVTMEPVHSDRIEACGYPVPLSQVKIVDKNSGNDLGFGKVGKILLKSPQLFLGYYNDLNQTFNAIDEDQWFITDDIGFLDKNGRLHIIDKNCDFIDYKGVNVSPTAIESILLSHEAVMEAAVVGIPYKESEQLPGAFVVINDQDITSEQLLHFANECLSKQNVKLKGGLYIVDEIPKNGCGLIMRRKFREIVKEILDENE